MYTGVADDGGSLVVQIQGGSLRTGSGSLGVGLLLGGNLLVQVDGIALHLVRVFLLLGGLLGYSILLGILLGGGSLFLLLSRGILLGGLVVGIGDHQVLDVTANLIGIVALPELQVGTTGQQLQHTVLVLHTRHFDHDARLTFQALDVGLNDTELIDTVADDVLGIVDSRLHLSLQGADHILVGALGIHLVAHLLCSEDLCQATAIGILVPFLNEDIDEVVVLTFVFYSCLIE